MTKMSCVRKSSQSRVNPKFVVTRALVGVASIALVAGCGSSASSSGNGGGGSSGNGGGGGVTTITVGTVPAVSGAIIGYAADKGYFSKHNLDVKTKELNGGAAAVPALQGNAIQVAQSNVLSVIQGANQGLNVPCFAGAVNFGGDGVSLPLIAGAKGGVTKASDLAGKSIAVNATGGVNELATDAYLASQGVDYKQVKYVAMPYPNMPQAVGAGQVDAVVPVDPFAAQILGKGGKLLTNNVAASVAGKPIYACWNASGDWLAKNPAVAKNFVDALTEASAATTADFTSFKEYLKTKGNTPAAVADNVTGLDFTTTMSNDDIMKWQDAGKKYGILTSGNVDNAKAYQPVTG